MVNFYLVINDNAGNPYLIGRFSEMITGNKTRQLSITIYESDYQKGDSILVDLSSFYAENSISKIAVLDANNKEVYVSTNYSEVMTCMATLHNIADDNGEYSGMEYSITLEAPLN